MIPPAPYSGGLSALWTGGDPGQMLTLALAWLTDLPGSRLLLPSLLTLFALYAESHYRMGFLPSRLFRRMPEIILDVPHRLTPGAAIPLLLLIKEAQRFPVELVAAEVRVTREGALLWEQRLELGGEVVTERLWWRILELPAPMAIGPLQVEARLEVLRGGRLHTIITDNYPGLSHAPLSIWLDRDPWPGDDHWFFGDLHYHSHLTDDQVEFGAPPAAAARMAAALGLAFIAVTDHSYDLDDHWDDCRRSDSQLGKWRWLQQFVAEHNRSGISPVIIAGEELSAGNARGRNVHFLLLNEPRFFAGWGDSAEKWLRTRPQWQVREVLDQLEHSSLAFAAHAESRPPLLQRLFLGRDHWRPEDYQHPRLDGVQMWNSLHDPALERGIAAWRELLLAGRRPVLIGGNDAHGDFGRWRQIAIPLFTIMERDEHLFGQVRTGVRRGAHPPSVAEILTALRAGEVIVTSGPSAWMQLQDLHGSLHRIGATCRGPAQQLQVEANSSPAFGPLTRVELCIGDLDRKKETRRTLLEHPSGAYFFRAEWTAEDLPPSGYLRLEISSQRAGCDYRCYSNPIFTAAAP